MREAAALLAPAGVDRETTRRLLLAGLAGETLRRGNGTLHRRDRVLELGDRPWVVSPTGEGQARRTFVARLPTYPVLSSGERQDAARGPWRISALGRVSLRADIDRHGSVPLVATLGGFVVLGAEIVGIAGIARRSDQPCGAFLTLRPAGAWFEDWTARRLGSSGRHQWWVWPDGLWSRPAAAEEEEAAASLGSAQRGAPTSLDP